MRFICFLLGSALLHAAFLALPLSTSTGDAGRNAPQPLRVRLLDPGIRSAEAASEQVPRERPQTLAQDRAGLTVRSPAAPKALGQSRASGKAARTARKQAGVGPKPRTRKAPKTASVGVRSGAPPAALAVPPAPVQAALRTSIAAAPAPETPDGPSRGRWTAGSVEGPPGEAPGRERGPWASPGRGAGAARTPVRYARVVKPKYPRKARTAGWEGTTVLKVRVDRGGRPGLIAVDRSSGFEVLDRAAVRAMRRWEFHPARNGRGTVASWVKVPVSFRIEEDRP